jgi:hypothetical protein
MSRALDALLHPRTIKPLPQKLKLMFYYEFLCVSLTLC